MAKLDFIVRDGKVIKDLTLTDKIVDAVDKGLHIGTGCCFNSKGIRKIVVVTSNEPIDKPVGIVKKGMCFFGELSHKEALEMKMELVDGDIPKYVIKNLRKYSEAGRKGEKSMETTRATQTTETAQVTTGNVEVEEKVMGKTTEIVEAQVTTQAADEAVEKATESLEIEVQQMSVGETDEGEESESEEEKERRRREEELRERKENELKKQKKCLDKLLNEGCEKLDENTLVVGKDITGEHRVFVRAMKSISDNQRKYLIAEMNSDGVEVGIEAKNALFKAADIKKGATKIDNWIGGFEGIYEGMMGDIKRRLQTIEKCRLLETAPILEIGEKTFEQIFGDLEKWFYDNLENSCVGCCKIKDTYHVGIVKRGEKTPDKIFDKVFKEIAPKNSYSAFKRELYRKDLIFHDYSDKGMDFQKGLSLPAMVRLGVISDKMISIKFDKRVRKEMYVEYCMMNDLDLDLEDMIDDDSAA